MLDERSKQILFAVTQSYINKPEPVGSRFVTKKYDFSLSSATIRNIMADLEELGFLTQPHTSAGRVPTDRAYRFYVDTILNQRSSIDYDSEIANDIIKRLETIKNDINAFFKEVTATLSNLSNYMSIAQPPKAVDSTLKKIELIRYKDDLVAAVLLTKENIIKNKILKIDPSLTQKDLNRISNYLNSEYSGYTIDEIRNVLIKRLKTEKLKWESLLMQAIDIYEQILFFTENEIFIEGLFEVINLPDFANISKMREIYNAIKDNQLLLRIIEDLRNTEGIQVIIGGENPIEELNKFSIVASNYGSCSKKMGVIALIGPTRMNYSKAITMVDMVSRCVCEILREIDQED
ncbi:MAG: heat-inducible transcriptional repressor HrcA [Thermodesulfovibrionales bacterium]|nr:heat-inducible transcriptional repressor HrcA [Thermodesulfovibrionales bacterium]